MKISTLTLPMYLVASGFCSSALAQEANSGQASMTPAEALAMMQKALPVSIHGGVLYWYYEPNVHDYDSNSEIYYANLVLDTKFDEFNYHFEPRFRDTKLRTYFESNIWIQESYLSWRPSGKDGGILKAGKIYSQFGRFWDNVFYGNIPYFDGLKLDPDIGASWEQHVTACDTVGVDYSLQYFTQDGATNGSLQGRDTLSLPMSTERNIAVARVVPTFKLGEDTSATIGVSGMHFDADFDPATSDSSVTRENVEASFSTHGFSVFGDFTHQAGAHVVDFPLPGSRSRDIDYLMSGVSYKWDKLTFRYSYSYADYKDEDVKEDLHLPGIEYTVNDHLAIWLEFVYWNRNEPVVGDVIQDRSLNLILYGSF